MQQAEGKGVDRTWFLSNEAIDVHAKSRAMSRLEHCRHVVGLANAQVQLCKKVVGALHRCMLEALRCRCREH
eukprot:15336976-Alexandrium_andersonii.AAC.1